MFLHCVALDKAEVAEPWSKFAGVANSLFRFRICLGLVGMILTLPLLVFIGCWPSCGWCCKARWMWRG